MRGRVVLGVLAVALSLVAGPVAADRSLVAISGDLDYRITAQIDGAVTAHAMGVLASIAPEDGVPQVQAFRLVADRIDATYVKSIQSSDPLRDVTGYEAAFRHSVLNAADQQVEHESYTGPQVDLVAPTALWNLVAFQDPAYSPQLEITLPAGPYGLANAGADERLVRDDVPKPGAIQKPLGAAHAGAADALKVTAPGLAAELRGDFWLLLYGATFDVKTPGATDRVVTGRYDQVSYRNGLPVPVQESVNATALLKVHDGVFSLATVGDDAVLYAHQFRVEGRIAFDEPSGTLQEGDRAVEAGGGPLVLEGDLRVAARGPAYETEDGPYGPVTVRGLAYAPADASVVSGSLVLVAAGVAVAGTAATLRWAPGVRRWAFLGIAGFSMVGRDDALDHRSRQQIFDYVRQNPGATLSHVQRDIGLGWGTIEYHVAVLERLRLMVTKRVGGKRLLFCNGHSRLAEPHVWSLLQNPSVRNLAEGLEAGVALSQQEVAVRLGCSPQYAGRLLRKLTGLGLVVQQAEGARRRTFRSTPLLVDLEQKMATAPSMPIVDAALDPVV